MGALHSGHIGLIHRARKTCDVVICSIFVNPLQFNDPLDLARYPRHPAQDKALLEEAGCDMLFTPDKEEIFSDFMPTKYDLGSLDAYWEGPARPGHFQGVVNVVERLFFYVRPDQAFFGEKDRQQLTILAHVARELHWPEQIVACPTAREKDGLALSSRNMRLNPEQREQATALYRGLNMAREMAFTHPVAAIEQAVQEITASTPGVELDHFGIATLDTLRPIKDWEGLNGAVAMIAAQVGPVRLIDNVTLVRE